MVKQANRAGVMGFMLKPLRAAEVGPTLDLALARFREIRRLQQARAERPLVDQAKGKLMSDRQLSEAEAFRWLRRQAMDSRQRLGDVAREVLADEAASGRSRKRPDDAPRMSSRLEAFTRSAVEIPTRSGQFVQWPPFGLWGGNLETTA